MQIRKHDMGQWHAHTHRCTTLEQAMLQAERHLEYTTTVQIWPLGVQWVVIAYTSMSAN